MRAIKRKKVEAAGWKVADVGEFLGLSEAEEAFIELRFRLAEGLKARRTQKKLTQTDLAEAIQSSQSRVAKMEAGDLSVSVDLMVRSLIALGATHKEIARIIAPR